MKRFWLTFIGTFFIVSFLAFKPHGSSRIVQPIQFNHKLHIEIGMECQNCHKTVYTSSHATIPNTETCLECHEEALTESPEEEKIRNYSLKNELIPWIQIHSMPAHVFFTHRIHTTIGGVPCSTCHGDVASRITPFLKPEVKLSMSFCVDCHEQHGMEEDCSLCHR